MNKNQKISICILATIAVFLFGGVMFYYQKVQDQKKKLAERTAMKQQIEQETKQKIDSIYRNFTSEDLKMVDAKGFVHKLALISLSSFFSYANYQKRKSEAEMNRLISYHHILNKLDKISSFIDQSIADLYKISSANYIKNSKEKLKKLDNLIDMLIH